MPISLTCSQGHRWEVADSVRESRCPQCAGLVTSPNEATLSFAPAVSDPHAKAAAIAGPQPATLEYESSNSSACDDASRPQVPGFQILDELGRGGMGVVWRARDLSLDREVAIKFLSEKYAANSSIAARFVEEARITGQLQHPGIPAVYQVGKLEDDRPYLAMKLIKGRTLHDLLQDRSEERNYLAIFEAVCHAVGYAHARNVIHRDLKPANVMVGAFGEVQVMDWGLAKVLNGSAGHHEAPSGQDAPETEIRTPNRADYTQAGTIIGTPSFMPPEQAGGEIERIDQRSDVFALGGILLALLTGKPPYEAASAEAVRLLAVRGKLDSAYERLSKCSAEPELVSLAKRCLSFEPTDRPADAQAIADEVAHLRNEADARARNAELVRAKLDVQATERRKQQRMRRVLSFAIAASLLLGGVGVYLKYQEAKEQERIAKRKAHDLLIAVGERDAALKTADQQDQELRGLLDVSNMQLAQTAANDGLTQLAIERLAAVRPQQRRWDWHFLRDRIQGGILTIYGHTGSVDCIAFSPDGARLASGSIHDGVRIWNARTGRQILQLNEKMSGTRELSFSPDGSRIATVDLRTVCIWNAYNGTLIQKLSGHTEPITSICFSPDGTRLVTTSFDKTARIWDSHTSQQLLVFKQHREIVTEGRFFPNGLHIVTHSWLDRSTFVWNSRDGNVVAKIAKGKLQVMNFKTGQSPTEPTDVGSVEGIASDRVGIRLLMGRILRQITQESPFNNLEQTTFLNPGPESVGKIYFSPDGSVLATITRASYTSILGHAFVQLWDASSGERLNELRGHAGNVNGVAFSPDGTQIATASDDGTIRLWAVRGSSTPLNMERGDVTGFCNYSPRGDRLAVGTLDGARVYDTHSGNTLLEIHGQSNETSSIAFSPDGAKLAIATSETKGRILNALDGKLLQVLDGGMRYFSRLRFDSTGSYVAAISKLSDDDRGSALIWDAHNGQLIREVKPDRGFTALEFCPTSSTLCTGDGNGRVQLWNIPEGTKKMDLSAHSNTVTGLSFCADGKLLATTSVDGTARLWEVSTGKQLSELRGHLGQVGSPAISPDGSRLATAAIEGEKQTFRVWDTANGQKLIEWKVKDTGLCEVHWSPDGNHLTFAANGVVRTWSVRPRPARFLLGHSGEILEATFSPDGTRIATGSKDKTVRLWDASNGQQLAILEGYSGGVRLVQFSESGKYLLTDDDESTRIVWNLASGERIPDLPKNADTTSSRISPDGRWLALPTGSIVQIIDASEASADEISHRLLMTRPNIDWHVQEVDQLREVVQPILCTRMFHLDRLLAYLPDCRGELLVRRAEDSACDPFMLARTACHSPYAVPLKSEAETFVAILAIQRHPLSLRLLGGLFIRNNKPTDAIAPLKSALLLREGDRPPVEELLLALAFADMKQPDEAKRWLDKAALWLDRYKTPFQITSALGCAPSGPLFAATEMVKQPLDPRYNPFDWETWHECDVFRSEVEAKVK